MQVWTIELRDWDDTRKWNDALKFFLRDKMVMAEIPIFFVDAFASRPFRGNPAAVCILEPEHTCSTQWMQDVAAELKLSETAFVVPQTGSLRWFTPGAEVDLCGHATVATAVALREAGYLTTDHRYEFQTRSGTLSATLLDDGRVELDFPATPPTKLERTSELSKVFPQAEGFFESPFDLMVVFPSEESVVNWTPDFSELAELEYRGIIVTASSDDESIDFVSRFFAPAVGVDEDPVTGSAHCCLAPYWGEVKTKDKMKAIQKSARGGEIELVWAGDRVRLRGDAVLVIKGTLLPDADS